MTSNKDKDELEVQSYFALIRAVEYCALNGLVFNTTKTKQLNMSKMRGEVLSFPSIERVEVTKHLGIIIDGTLSWVEHLGFLCSALSVLRRVRNKQ